MVITNIGYEPDFLILDTETLSVASAEAQTFNQSSPEVFAIPLFFSQHTHPVGKELTFKLVLPPQTIYSDYLLMVETAACFSGLS